MHLAACWAFKDQVSSTGSYNSLTDWQTLCLKAVFTLKAFETLCLSFSAVPPNRKEKERLQTPQTCHPSLHLCPRSFCGFFPWWHHKANLLFLRISWSTLLSFLPPALPFLFPFSTTSLHFSSPDFLSSFTFLMLLSSRQVNVWFLILSCFLLSLLLSLHIYSWLLSLLHLHFASFLPFTLLFFVFLIHFSSLKLFLFHPYIPYLCFLFSSTTLSSLPSPIPFFLFLPSCPFLLSSCHWYQ